MVYEEEKRRLADNVIWFEHFFDDLEKLLKQISRAMQSKYQLTKKKTSNPYSQTKPVMPVFYGLYARDATNTIQVFVILNPNLIQNTAFKPEPCIFVLKHSRGDAYFHSDELVSICTKASTVIWGNSPEGMVGGEFLDGYAKGAQFYAFQVSLDSFINNSNPSQAIQTKIIEPLTRMPAWKEK